MLVMSSSTPTAYLADPKTQELALHFLETRKDPNKSSNSLLSQISHRLLLASKWQIPSGSRILELGCGQGDTTVVLADAVGPEGHLDAVDPGSPDYGAPFTLSQAQAHISASPVGSRVSFHNKDPVEYLRSYAGEPYDYVVMSHCIYYFKDPSLLKEILKTIVEYGKVRRVCLAEWALSTATPSTASWPHILSVLLLADIESRRKTEGDGNVRCVLSPEGIKKLVRAIEGLSIVEEWTLESNKGLRDGEWEVSDTISNRSETLLNLLKETGDEKGFASLNAMCDTLEMSLRWVEGGLKGVKTMDVWTVCIDVSHER